MLISLREFSKGCTIVVPYTKVIDKYVLAWLADSEYWDDLDLRVISSLLAHAEDIVENPNSYAFKKKFNDDIEELRESIIKTACGDDTYLANELMGHIALIRADGPGNNLSSTFGKDMPNFVFNEFYYAFDNAEDFLEFVKPKP